MLPGKLKLLAAPARLKLAKWVRCSSTSTDSPEEQFNRSKHANLLRLVNSFRSYGHLAADLDPLGIQAKQIVSELDPERYSLPKSGASFNLNGIVHVGKKKDPSMPVENAPIERIVDHLQKTYCGKIAYEFRHIPNISERRWFAHMVESFDKKQFSNEEKIRIFGLLSRSEVFDHFMAKRFSQVKRYGLEGAESMMVGLDNVFRTSSQAGVVEVIVCMPHRGRLNLLTDLLQYSPAALFHKIKGNSEFPGEFNVSGDVLSHLANSVHLDYGSQRPLHITMLHNPSHLEAVNPVALGKARAKQMDMYDAETEGADCNLGDRVMCIQLHGDAAFTGQGVVMETLGVSNLPHFTSGGSIHVVVNNQIGYTTNAMNSRSSIYASDVGKMINAPVIHVNGDYPEQVAYAAMLAFEYRNKFRKDIVLDIITYRRWGHNEIDEPGFTQPSMYKNIRSRESVPKIYETKLLKEGVLKSTEEIDEFRRLYLQKLDQNLEDSRSYKPSADDYLKGKWATMIHPEGALSRIDTGVDRETLVRIGNASVALPADFSPHPRLVKHHLQARVTKMETGTGVDWATAEALAFGSLMLENHNIRISGQDVGRGTFSQRHIMLVDQDDETTIIPLNNMDPKQGRMEVANSSLSEFAVMGFEYGMSLETPNNLNIWEAQFGDFFNGAQVIIDTYLNSGEQKWLRQSGLVLLLPHGYDGAGPEHSSCRIERFLQLSDERFNLSEPRTNINWHVINPTTPAQYFHAIRRQLKRPYRKPMVVVAPKSLLKLAACVSSFDDMSSGTTFEPVLMDAEIPDPSAVERVVFLSGKMYYEVMKEKESRPEIGNKISFIRLEELCPFPQDELERIIPYFPKAKEYVWLQEEPQNMGAYTFIEPRLKQLLPAGSGIRYIGRKAAAAPATGIGKYHKQEYAQLMNEILSI